MAKSSAFAVNDTTLFGIPLCPGQNSVEYLGNTLVAGDVAFFHFNGSSGIDSIVKVVVFVSPVLDFWATTSPICKGSTDGVIDFWDHVDIAAPYVFSLDGGMTYFDEYTYTGLPAGSYELRAKNRFGCVFEYELTIPTLPKLEIETNPIVFSCEDSVLLDFSIKKAGNSTYSVQWQAPNDELVSIDSTCWATMSGNYRLQVSNECDTIVKTIDVNLGNGASEVSMYAPKSFSPNGDGINDCFVVHFGNDVQIIDYQMLVFDRWGGEVFRGHSMHDCWDGTTDRGSLQLGIYVWQLTTWIPDCGNIGKRLVWKGEISLIK